MMNKLRIILGVIFLLLFSISVLYLGQQFSNKSKKQICTQEAKLCPDGSTVSRIGPNCEFAKCPLLTSAPSISINPKSTLYEINNLNSNTNEYVDLKYNFSF